MRKRLSSIFLCLSGMASFGHGPQVTFVENLGQWPEQVLYRALIPGGALFVERDALTYVVGGAPAPHFRTSSTSPHPHAPPERFHAYRVHFDGAQGGQGEGLAVQPHYENHFIGNDSSRWASRAAVYGAVLIHDLLPGVSLRLDGSQGLKYDLLVAPGADPSAIHMRYEGHEGLGVDTEGQLVVGTSVGPVREEPPYAFQDLPSGRVEIPCYFAVDGDALGFALPEGHESGHTLVIDPVLVFSTYSGSTARNFGFTATYDNGGHLYGGGIAFAPGYPTTLGALQEDYNGGTVDMAITKFALDGTSLLWSTYIGGDQSEAPHSMVVNDNDELFILGTTGSANFPVTAGCYDATFAGGPELTFVIGYGFEYVNGVDLVVSRLSAGGDALLGSTYLGGTDNDGINNAPDLAFNYGDSFRGEIVLDAQERPVVATCTRSADAPTTPGAAQAVFGGGEQDGYLFRMDAALTSLQWATFYGGSQDDAAYGLQLATNGDIYVAGGSNSADLPMAGSPFDGTANGGVDGYLLRVAPGGPWLSSTFVGTPAYDQCYFVQLNTDDEVFVVGQSEGDYPVTPGKYSVPGSAQFIHKFTSDLSGSLWSTVFGTGNGTVDVAPSAFLVSDCGQIYFSGWGGTVNQNNSQADFSTTTGLEVSPDAYQSTTDGSDFYLLVLEPEAEELNYATFLGGGISAEHVDGGTSRFDKDGNIYQAVCGGCFGNSDFPTSSGAWSSTNNTDFSCNLAVVKFGLGQNQAIVGIDGPAYVCMPDPAQFLNLSIGGTGWQWDFGDGSGSIEAEPLHQYTEPGTYTVSMILTDASGCIPNDTAWMTIVVEDPLDAAVAPVDPICPGGSVQLQATGGHAYAWFPADGLSDTTIADPVATPPAPMTYTVVVTDSCGTDTATVEVTWLATEGEASPDVEICLGDSAQLAAFGGASYLWIPATGLNDPEAQQPLAAPDSTTTYTVMITTADGCELEAEQTVNVTEGPPEPVLEDAVVCLGASVQLLASGGNTYQWMQAPGIEVLDVSDPVVSPPQSMFYSVLVGNACATVMDSVWVEVVEIVAQAWSDTTICPGGQALLQAAGGEFYVWQPADGLSDAGGNSTIASPTEATTYEVTVSDLNGCSDVASVTVWLHPAPWVTTGPDQNIPFGDVAQLLATGEGTFAWSPPDGLSCSDCHDPVALPPTSTTYTVTLTDTNGCTATASVSVFLEGTLFVPNTFTPNGDGVNDRFLVIATEVATFRLDVFNRWGELIHTTEDVNAGWDGTYRGVMSPIDTYVWRVDLTDMQGTKRTLFGHVNLVR